MTSPLRAWVLATSVVAACSPSEPAEPHDPEHHDDAHEHSAANPASPVHIEEAVLSDAGVETEAASMHRLAPTVQLFGQVVADPDRRSRVAARLAGTVESTRKGPGDQVDKGDVIAVIRAPNLQALRSAAAALEAKGASARANAERLDALVDKRMASLQEAIAAKAEAAALEAEAKAARDRLRGIGLRRSGRGPVLFQVRAPMGGIVVDRAVVDGDPVTAQSVVATIVGMDRVWFEAQVFERDVARLELGSRVAVTLNAYPNDTFEGAIEYLSHQAEPIARTLTARVPLDNAGDKLRLGLFGSARVTAGPADAEPVLAVVSNAIVGADGQDVVFVRGADGRFVARTVRVGRRDTQRIEILDGIEIGEQVVTEGTFSIKSILLSRPSGDHH